MVRPRIIALSLILVGVVILPMAIVGYGVENTPLTPGQSEYVTAILLIVSLGFMATGWFWRRDVTSMETRYRQIPALALVFVAVFSTIGIFFVFQPWASRGFARDALWVITGAISILGGVLALAGVVWFRQREARQPLAILAGILSVGLFHRYAQVFDPNIAVPVVALIAVIIAAVPAIVIFRIFPSRPAI